LGRPCGHQEGYLRRWRDLIHDTRRGRFRQEPGRVALPFRGNRADVRNGVQKRAGRLKPTLRQLHVAGEKLFVDYSGHTMEVVDGLTGEVRSTQIFVAVLGASNYTYAEASLSQSLPDWIASHVRAFSFFGGVARQTVSDNLKAGITRACFHEPMVNQTYADLARHYRTAIVPARPYRPRDKAKVEVGVQIVGRWILARLRNRRFFSLAALNEAIYALLVELNERPLRSWGRSRRELFEELDNVRRQEQALSIAKAKFQGGGASELDVFQAENVLEQTRASIPQLTIQLQQGENALSVLLGVPPAVAGNAALSVGGPHTVAASNRRGRHPSRSVAPQARSQEGSSPSGARMRSAVSKGGGNASPASGESRWRTGCPERSGIRGCPFGPYRGS
jgi:transposase